GSVRRVDLLDDVLWVEPAQQPHDAFTAATSTATIQSNCDASVDLRGPGAVQVRRDDDAPLVERRQRPAVADADHRRPLEALAEERVEHRLGGLVERQWERHTCD